MITKSISYLQSFFLAYGLLKTCVCGDGETSGACAFREIGPTGSQHESQEFALANVLGLSECVIS